MNKTKIEWCDSTWRRKYDYGFSVVEFDKIGIRSF